MKYNLIRISTIFLFTFLLSAQSTKADLQTNHKDPGMTQIDWRYHQQPSCGNNPNGLWSLIGVEVDGTPCSGEVISIDWSSLSGGKKVATLTIDNQNNSKMCSSARNYFGIQAAPNGYKNTLKLSDLEKYVVRVKVANSYQTSVCESGSSCTLCPPDYAGHTGGWVTLFIGMPMTDLTHSRVLWLELVIFGTSLSDYHQEPEILFHGVNPSEELYRILVSHPLVNKPSLAPGQERFYEVDMLPIIKGLSWEGTNYDWNNIILADAYIGSEIWSDAKASFTVSNFDVLYEEIVSIPGDANGDGVVDGLDYVIWLSHYNETTGNGPNDGDFDESGKVDGLDYVIWLNNYQV